MKAVREPPGWEALGGLPDQAHSSSLAVTACTGRRRLPTPAGQPRELPGAIRSKIEGKVKKMQETKKVVIVNGRA